MEQFVLGLCRELNKAGHQNEILTLNRLFSNPQKSLLASEELGLPWGTIRINRIFAPGFTSIFLPRLGPFDFSAFDVIHYHCIDAFLPFLLQKIGDKPLVVTTHGGWFHTQRLMFFKKLIFVGLLPRFLNRAQKIAACSVSDYLRFSPLFPQTVLLPNGIDWQDFQNHRQDIDPFCLIHVAANRPSKRIELLLRRFLELHKTHPQTKLHLIGQGPWPGHIPRELICQPGLTLHQEVPHEHLKALFLQAGIVVSASEYEGFGLAVAEAMASGCIPILQSNQAYQSFILDVPGKGLSGRLIDYSVPNSLLTAFDDLLAQPNLLSTSHLCRNLTQIYDWEKVGQSYSDLYSEALLEMS